MKRNDIIFNNKSSFQNLNLWHWESLWKLLLHYLQLFGKSEPGTRALFVTQACFDTVTRLGSWIFCDCFATLASVLRWCYFRKKSLWFKSACAKRRIVKNVKSKFTNRRPLLLMFPNSPISQKLSKIIQQLIKEFFHWSKIHIWSSKIFFAVVASNNTTWTSIICQLPIFCLNIIICQYYTKNNNTCSVRLFFPLLSSVSSYSSSVSTFSYFHFLCATFLKSTSSAFWRHFFSLTQHIF